MRVVCPWLVLNVIPPRMWRPSVPPDCYEFLLPRTAVFDVSGKPTVYVRSSGGFDAHEIRVKAWTDSVAVVENIERAAEVALVNPNSPSGARPKTQAPAPQRASR